MSLEWRLLKVVYYPKSTAVRFCGNSYILTITDNSEEIAMR